MSGSSSYSTSKCPWRTAWRRRVPILAQCKAGRAPLTLPTHCRHFVKTHLEKMKQTPPSASLWVLVMTLRLLQPALLSPQNHPHYTCNTGLLPLVQNPADTSGRPVSHQPFQNRVWDDSTSECLTDSFTQLLSILNILFIQHRSIELLLYTKTLFAVLSYILL